MRLCLVPRLRSLITSLLRKCVTNLLARLPLVGHVLTIDLHMIGILLRRNSSSTHQYAIETQGGRLPRAKQPEPGAEQAHGEQKPCSGSTSSISTSSTDSAWNKLGSLVCFNHVFAEERFIATIVTTGRSDAVIGYVSRLYCRLLKRCY